jgi:hypothetical protein
MTVEMWFRSVKATRHHLWTFDSGSTTNLSCDINDSGIGLWIYWNGGGSPAVQYGTAGFLSDGTIKQLVFVHNGNVNQVYLNNVLLTPSAVLGSQTFTTVGGTTTFVGSGALANYTQGNIYNFKVYDRGLNATEVAQNFNATRGRYGL